MNSSKLNLDEIRRNSIEHREQFLIDQAVAMELKVKLIRSKSLLQLKHIESVRHQYKNLRLYLDKNILSSPQSIIITHTDGSIETNRETSEMHQHIIQHNKKYFNQAQGSPPTTQPLLKIIGNGLNTNSQK